MAAKRKPTRRDPLAGESFIDINSPAVPRGRAGPPKGSPPRPRPPGPGPRKRPEKRGPRPWGKTARRVTLLLAVLAMVAATALLCVFLLFKVADIQVTGDPVYSPEDVLALCDYQIGDNLLFATTQDQEERLEAQLPYVEDAQVIKHFPNTLEIHITAAQAAASISSGGGWLYVSSQGKILELNAQPAAAAMEVSGFTSTATQPGQYLQAEDEAALAALEEILTALSDLGMLPQCTRLDLTDLYNITLWYQDRVQCKLGSTAELTYKLQLGYKALADPDQEGKIGEKETGVLDLSYAADSHNASFAAGPVDPEGSSSSADPNAGGTGETSDGATDTEDGSTGTEDGTAEAGDGGDATGESSGGRGDDIPDAPFETGGATGTAGDSTGETGGATDGTGDSAADPTGEGAGGRGGDIPDAPFTG